MRGRWSILIACGGLDLFEAIREHVDDKITQSIGGIVCGGPPVFSQDTRKPSGDSWRFHGWDLVIADDAPDFVLDLVEA